MDSNIMYIKHTDAEWLCPKSDCRHWANMFLFPLKAPESRDYWSPRFENVSTFIIPWYFLVMEMTFTFLKCAAQPAY